MIQIYSGFACQWVNGSATMILIYCLIVSSRYAIKLHCHVNLLKMHQRNCCTGRSYSQTHPTLEDNQAHRCANCVLISSCKYSPRNRDAACFGIDPIPTKSKWKRYQYQRYYQCLHRSAYLSHYVQLFKEII